MYLETDEDLDAVLAPPETEPLVLERIYGDIPSISLTFELVNRYQRANPYHALGFRAGQWFEVSREIYWHFLEAVPPLHMTSGGFVVGECTMDDLYQSFFEIEGRYYTAALAWRGPRSLAALWTALLAEVAP